VEAPDVTCAWDRHHARLVAMRSAASRFVRGAFCAGIFRVGMVGVGAFGVGALLTACGGDDPGELQGIVRSEPLVVGGASVTEVTEGIDPAPFAFVADPGELLVVYFGYTNCPDLCPTTLAALRSAKKELGDDADLVDLAMVTVDPARDTPEIMNDYLGSFTEKYHALVPASDEELSDAQEAFLVTSAVIEKSDGTFQVDHSANAFVVDENGVVLVEWPFGHAKAGMVNDLGVLLADLT
jgi:protein SCO1